MHERNKDVGLLKNEPHKDLSIGTVLKIKVKIACSFDHEWIPYSKVRKVTTPFVQKHALA